MYLFWPDQQVALWINIYYILIFGSLDEILPHSSIYKIKKISFS